MTVPHVAPRKRVVLTGGPGGGKTAVLEVIRRDFGEAVEVLPESASIVFGGGFPRRTSDAGRRAAQRTIFRVQRELERLAVEDGTSDIILCDRGSLDSLAYWPGTDAEFFFDLETSLAEELARYSLVLHLRTPAAHHGYNHKNPLRVESARQAAEIDERISRIWSAHPRVVTIECHARFLDKVRDVVNVLRDEAPARIVDRRET